MAAPTPSFRTIPTVPPLGDGHSTTINFVPYDPTNLLTTLGGAVPPLIQFWEKSVTPPGMDGGQPVATDTMWNQFFMTMRPRKLQTMTEASGVAAYNPSILINMVILINMEGTFTVIHPDGSGWAFYGYFRVLKPQDDKNGEQPTLQFTIQPTNVDPRTGQEAAPVYVLAPTAQQVL